MADLTIFDELFVYDLANNHMGDMAHAERVIREVAKVSNKAGVRGALKFQFRQLDTFIHPDFQDRMDIKYIKRFAETRLENQSFERLADVVKECGLLTMCTPFDEDSVDVICEQDIDIIKIASCSADDWPLLQKVSKVNKPLVVSTAGLRLDEIDRLVSFLQSQNCRFAIMHCVALYPTPDENLELDQIRQLRRRYLDVPVGWSTHEDQDNTSAIQIAYALGARVFERHVGIPTEAYSLNAYSSSPDQLDKWLTAYRAARQMIGAPERAPALSGESETLKNLKRGTFASRAIKKGERLTASDVFFAMPYQHGTMTSGEFRDGMIAQRDYAAREALDPGLYEPSDDDLIYQIMLQVRGILNSAGVVVNDDAEIEISHHYGLSRFREFGAVLITCVNRDYAKKLVIQLPRQKHPYHYHEKKEETFQLLAGDLEVVKDGYSHKLSVGETLLVEPGAWHKFHTLDGCLFEEISSTAFKNDSFYEDPQISKLPVSDRKTKVGGLGQAFLSASGVDRANRFKS